MTPIADFSRRYKFSASHRLHVSEYSDFENQQTFGKCNNPHGHGHNYILELTVRGPVDAVTGMVVNLVNLDQLVKERVLSRFDLANLNCDPSFASVVPSTENLCRAAWDLMDDGPLGSAHLQRLRIEETVNNSFDYEGPRAGSHSGDPARKEN